MMSVPTKDAMTNYSNQFVRPFANTMQFNYSQKKKIDAPVVNLNYPEYDADLSHQDRFNMYGSQYGAPDRNFKSNQI